MNSLTPHNIYAEVHCISFTRYTYMQNGSTNCHHVSSIFSFHFYWTSLESLLEPTMTRFNKLTGRFYCKKLILQLFTYTCVDTPYISSVIMKGLHFKMILWTKACRNLGYCDSLRYADRPGHHNA